MLDINPLLITCFLFQILCNLFFIFIWKSKAFVNYHNVYKAEQKIHLGFIPRFGGITMIASLSSILMFDYLSIFWHLIIFKLLLAMFPVLFVTILEDVYNNILPLARLFFIVGSSVIIFIFSSFKLPIIDLPLFTELFITYPWILILILVFALTSMANAFNFIDGVNGLLLLNFICILACLKFMAKVVGDFDMSNLMDFMITVCLIQLFFNFPKSFIFCGDLGAYGMGIIVSVIVIIFFGQYPEFLTWQAILILFYPACELGFTIFRRCVDKVNPFQPDRLHLHQQIYSYLNLKFQNRMIHNPLTSVILLPIYGFPFFWIYIHGAYLDLFQTLVGMGFILSLYLCFYFFFKKSNQALMNKIS